MSPGSGGPVRRRPQTGYVPDQTLGRHVEWVSVCPEVEMGLGTPRETLRLVRDARGIRMITTRTGIDHTGAMHAWSRRRIEALAREDLDGYVLKKDSPSCGMERVKIFRLKAEATGINLGTGLAKSCGFRLQAEEMPSRDGRGLFAAALVARLPLLPIEEEGRLCDPRLRENFIERVFAYRRLRALFAGRWSYGAMVQFHTAHKMSLLAHSTTAYQELGRLVAEGRALTRRALRNKYETLFMNTLAIPATTRRHTNVLMHMAGHLKKQVDGASKQELAACIDDYRRGLVPLVVPMTMIRHYVRVHGTQYLAGQIYLEPHPRELMLRNHV